MHSLDYASAIRKISVSEAWKADTLQKMNEAALLPPVAEKKAVPFVRKLLLPFAAAVAVLVVPLIYFADKSEPLSLAAMPQEQAALQENETGMAKSAMDAPMAAAAEPDLYTQEQAELRLFAGEGVAQGAAQQGGYDVKTLKVLSCELVQEMPTPEKENTAQMPPVALPAYRFEVQSGTQTQLILWVEATV